MPESSTGANCSPQNPSSSGSVTLHAPGSRRELLLWDLPLSCAWGVELGPLDKPLVTRRDGKIIYVDFCSVEELQDTYAVDPGVDVNQICVDVVCRGRPLKSALGHGFIADYIIASHVIEHVPNLIGWLDELMGVLRPGGEVRLAVPDKRYCFDFLRAETSLGDVVGAYLRDDKKPSPGALMDCLYYHCPIECMELWQHRPEEATRHFPNRETAFALAQESQRTARYIDVHCWVFTPTSFVELFRKLAQMGLMSAACCHFTPTWRYGSEFFVFLRREHDRQQIQASWEQASQIVAAHERSLYG